AGTPTAIAGPDARALGADPATGDFGAVRVAAEFPASPRFASRITDRHQYFWFADANRTAPTEALDALGRIAAGLGDTVRTEAHRPGDRETIRFLGREVDVPVDPAAEHTGLVAPSDEQRQIARRALELLRPDANPAALLHGEHPQGEDRKSTRLNSSHAKISYAVFCLKKNNLRYNDAY